MKRLDASIGGLLLCGLTLFTTFGRLATRAEAGARAPAPAPGAQRAVGLGSFGEWRQSLSASEQSERVRDAVMAAAFGAMSPDPAYVRIYLAIRPPVRRPYYQGLAEFDVGP